jgi:hypothetical protein
MAYEVLIGRQEKDKEAFGKRGTVLIGKQYIKMGQVSSLSNKIYLDIARSHIVFVCGKRGGGKSYTLGVICEGLSDMPEEVRDNLAILILDTMGIYWTMKFANKKDEKLLIDWGIKGKGLDVVIFTPVGYYKSYKEKGIPTDHPFSVKPSELDASDWSLTFELEPSSPVTILIESIINELKESGDNYDIDEIIKAIETNDKFDQQTKNAGINRFESAKAWGLFSNEGTPLGDIIRAGQVSILDVSCYVTSPGTSGVKALSIGLIAHKLFVGRMIARKDEEYKEIHHTFHYFEEETKSAKLEKPMVWLVIDEAHEFLPKEGKTAASNALITIMREGRQPGISLILATQQPGKIHTDVMTQSDVVISHRLTAKPDVEALGMLMQSYMREGLDKHLNNLPRVKGAAIVFDDVNERIYPIRIRPRFTWHGGEAPMAVKSKEKTFEL